MNLSPAHQGYRNAGTLAFLSLGPSRAKIHVYDGAQPAAGAAVTTQVRLLTLILDATPGEMVGNALHLGAAAVGLIAATGAPTWARIENGNAEWAADCTASAAGAGGEIQLEVHPVSGNLNAGGGSGLVSAVIA